MLSRTNSIFNVSSKLSRGTLVCGNVLSRLNNPTPSFTSRLSQPTLLSIRTIATSSSISLRDRRSSFSDRGARSRDYAPVRGEGARSGEYRGRARGPPVQSDGAGDESEEIVVDDLTSSDASAVDATGFDPSAPPTKTFQDMKDVLSPEIYKALVEKPFQFTHMSPVQEAVISLLSNGLCTQKLPTQEEVEKVKERIKESEDVEEIEKLRNSLINPPTPDLIVKSKTGTGKTLGFLVPALESRISRIEAEKKLYEMFNPSADKNSAERHTQRYIKQSVGTLIISPTRELATQIANECIRLIHHLRLFEVNLLVGGADRNRQIRNLLSGRKDVVVATPGRMIDLLESEPDVRRAIGTAQTLILDEADTLMDMGFKDDINRIIEYMAPKKKRQTFMFSATFPTGVREIAQASMNSNPRFIDTVPKDDTGVHEHIPQYYTVLEEPNQFIPHLTKLIIQDQLQHPEGGKTVIFLPTTKYTQLISQVMLSLKPLLPFGRDNTKILEMHSKKSQESRTRASGQFRRNLKGIYQILVTSDVSARGVDYPGVTRVIQVGIPSTPDLYVHRVGRTGRAGKEGRGDLVLLPFESRYVKKTIGHIPLKLCDVEELKNDCKKLAEEYDNLPPTSKPSFDTQDFRPRKRSGFATVEVSGTGIQPQSLQRLEKLDPFIFENLVPQIPAEETEGVFTSQLGYYVGKSPDLKVTKDDILDGLKQWCTESLGMESAPSLSQTFLQRLGFSEGGRRGFNRGGGGGGFGDWFGSGRGGPFGRERGGFGSDRRGGRGGRGGRSENTKDMVPTRWGQGGRNHSTEAF